MTKNSYNNFGFARPGDVVTGMQDRSLEATADTIAGVIPLDELVAERVDTFTALKSDPETESRIVDNSSYVRDSGVYRDTGPNSYI